MDNFWLKALGGGARIGRMPDDWRSVDNGIFQRAVTFAHNSSVEPGDKIVLYAAGWGAVFAAGTAQSYPYELETGDRWLWRVDFELDVALPAIHDGVPLQALNVDDRDLRAAIKRRSHIRLSQREYEAAIRALANREGAVARRW